MDVERIVQSIEDISLKNGRRIIAIVGPLRAASPLWPKTLRSK